LKRSRFTEHQIIKILKEAKAGAPITDLGRQHGFSRSSFNKWKSKYCRMDASSLKRLKELEEENRKLKQMYADLSLELMVLKDVIEKKVTAAQQRELAQYAAVEYELSERKACRFLNISGTAYRYPTKKPDDDEIKQQLQILAERKPRWG